MYNVSFSCRYNGKCKVVLIMRVATFFFSFLSLAKQSYPSERWRLFSIYLIPVSFCTYLGGRCAETFSFCVPQHTFGTMNWTLYMLQECQIPCHSLIHSFITQSFGRSSRALWTALCGSIHVARPTLVLIDQQHANKGIHVAQFDCCGLGLGGTHTHTFFLSLSLSICAIEERHSRALKKRT